MGGLVSHLRIPYEGELPAQEMQGDANECTRVPMTPAMMVPMTPADLTRTMEVRSALAETLKRVEEGLKKDERKRRPERIQIPRSDRKDQPEVERDPRVAVANERNHSAGPGGNKDD